MNFGQALEALKNGSKVARSGWNGKGMWLFYVPGDQWAFGQVPALTRADRDGNHYKPWYGMKTADNGLVPWLASQSDIDATDWVVVE
jgi:hypothetical protein